MKIRKSITFVFLLLLVLAFCLADAQSWMNTPDMKKRLAETDAQALNFFEMQHAFSVYCKKQAAEGKAGEEEGEQLRGYNQFKRWNHFHRFSSRSFRQFLSFSIQTPQFPRNLEQISGAIQQTANGGEFEVVRSYFPIQNLLKIFPNKSSVYTSPVMLPR